MTYQKGNRVLVQGTELARIVQPYHNSDKYKVRQDNGLVCTVRKPELTFIGRRPQ